MKKFNYPNCKKERGLNMKLTKDDLEKELLNVFKKSIKHKETAIEYHEIHIRLLQESISKLKPRLENTSGGFKKTISQTISNVLIEGE